MRLSRMGAFFPTRLSFMRSLIRRLHTERAMVTRSVWEIDDDGYGRAVYSVTFGGDVYSLVAFSTSLDPEQRTDRVIAEAWDTTYVLFDGRPTSADLDRLAIETPRQEAGRFSKTELVLSRANKSLRLFAHVVDSLAVGRQPDRSMIGKIGYLMRTTAVYGNGKFGIADRLRILERPAVNGPFQLELLTVWLIRGFTHDLVEHIAKMRDPKRFRPLASDIKRHLGIGNATGLGMAPFLVNHPILLHSWMLARETAFARVRSIERASPATIDAFLVCLARARRHIEDWQVDDISQMDRILTLRREMKEIAGLSTQAWLAEPYLWDRLTAASERWSEECQELLLALMLEPHGELIDDLSSKMASDVEPTLQPSMSIGELADLLDETFAWAAAMDFGETASTQRFWYISEEKLEPRLGDRYREPGAEKELPLDIARQIQTLRAAIDSEPRHEIVAHFLMRHPEHRRIARRVQTTASNPYAEIRDNLLGADCRPIDMLRCKLSFFGASKFDPKSDLWTRITLYQGAPTFEQLGEADADDWSFPVLGDAA
ncbi:MAG: hypothetical protein AAF543_02470 [Pseudomonadota bacterium]